MKLDPKKILEALKKLVDEYNFTPEEVYEVVKMWIKTAFRRDYLNKNKRILLDMIMNEKWDIKIYRVYHVIDDNEEIIDDEKQIHLSDAKKEKDDIEVGEDLLIDITPEQLEFSRIAAQSAAQTIKQQIKKIEKERFFRTFEDSEWDILTAKVKYVQWDIVILEFSDGNTWILPPDGQIKWKNYEVWEEIKVLLKQIRRQGSDIILEITQSAPEYVESLMKKYIPEIEEWKVEIVKSVRLAGIKTMILVKTDDERIDPVGVCVWEWANRISTIIDELNGEKVVIIEYVDDMEQLVKNIFSPAKIKKIEIKWNEIDIYADEHQKPLIFGKWAINLKLASKLLWKRVIVK